MNSIYSAPSRAPAGTRASRLPAPAENAITRGAFAQFIAASRVSPDHRDAEAVAQALWPSDRAPGAVLRAVAAPAGTADHPALVQSSTADFLADLESISAGASLIAAGLQVSLAGRGTLTIPSRNFALTGLPWIAEGEPVQVRQFAFGARDLGPQGTVAAIVVLSRALAKRSAAVAIFSRLLREEAGLAVDAALFNNAAASGDSPAGLLHGAHPGAVNVALMDDTLEGLAGAVAAGGGVSVGFIAAPRQAIQIKLRRPDLAFPVWGSPAVPTGRVIALDPSAFVSGITISSVDTVTEAALHMSDDPQQIVAEGGPASDPVRSLWQTDTVAVRVWLDIAFMMRADGLVAYADGCNWADYA